MTIRASTTFRYADPSGIRNFIDTFENSSDLSLEECRRCDQDILNIASAVAQQDINRLPKELHARRGASKGDVRILRFDNNTQEVDEIARCCLELVNHGVKPERILILLRSNFRKAFSNPLVAKLQQLGLDCSVPSSKAGPLDERDGRILLSYLRLISSSEDDLAWRSLIFHSPGLGTRATRKIYDYAVSEGIRFHQSLVYCASNDETLPRKTRSLLQTLVKEVELIIAEFAPILEGSDDEEAPTLTPEELIAPVRELADRTISDEQNRASLVGFLSQIAEFSNASNLTTLLTSLATKSEDLEEEPETGKINIMTMHSAKGLSADVVFVMAAEDQSLPLKEDGASIDDDRRLLYVSLTRARHTLFISYCGARRGLQAHSGRSTPNGVRSLTRYLRDLQWPITQGANFSRTLAGNVDLAFVQAEAGLERDSQSTL